MMSNVTLVNTLERVGGAAANYPIVQHQSALHRALDQGNFRAIKYLLPLSRQVDERDPRGWVPLMRCSELPRESQGVWLARSLLKTGAQIRLRDKDGRTALFHALLRGRVRLTEVLLENNDLDLHQRDANGETLLHYLATSRDPHLWSCVLEHTRRHHVHLEVENAAGLTPLMLACYLGHLELARVLVDFGASVTRQDPEHHRCALEWLFAGLAARQMSGHNFPEGELNFLRTTSSSTLKQENKMIDDQYLQANFTKKSETLLNDMFKLYEIILSPSFLPTVSTGRSDCQHNSESIGESGDSDGSWSDNGDPGQLILGQSQALSHATNSSDDRTNRRSKGNTAGNKLVVNTSRKHKKSVVGDSERLGSGHDSSNANHAGGRASMSNTNGNKALTPNSNHNVNNRKVSSSRSPTHSPNSGTRVQRNLTSRNQ